MRLQPPGRRSIRAGAGAGGRAQGPPAVEHRFELLSLDRKTGKILWQRTATTAVPHEGVHSTYGSFASNSPVTDGQRVYAFFGSRGIYCYDLKGTLVWQKDFGVKMRMRMAFGEGMAPVSGRRSPDPRLRPRGRLVHRRARQGDGQGDLAGPRNERTNWAAPLVVDFKGRKQVVVARPQRSAATTSATVR